MYKTFGLLRLEPTPAGTLRDHSPQRTSARAKAVTRLTLLINPPVPGELLDKNHGPGLHRAASRTWLAQGRAKARSGLHRRSRARRPAPTQGRKKIEISHMAHTTSQQTSQSEAERNMKRRHLVQLLVSGAALFVFLVSP